MDIRQESLRKHYEWKGKLEVRAKTPVTNAEELSLAYTPGVAQPCLEIQKRPELSYELTGRGNLVAVITDGTAVLGLGDIGPEAGMPVMEGKCALFREFAGVDAIPLCLRTKDPDEFVRAVELLAGSFGGINLEDISAPRCFAIERALKKLCDIPVFHDDQHGTAVVALAALTNAAKIVGKDRRDMRLAICGAGAAGTAIARLMLRSGIGEVCLADINGAVYAGREGMDAELADLAAITNREGRRGGLAEVVSGADAFIGVSAPGILKADMVRSMAKDPIVFAMANPTPEIQPDLAKEAGAAVVGTGRSDYPNQINNVLAFPGIFRGALDARASDINEEMQLAASAAIASLVSEEDLRQGRVIPNPFDRRVVPAVAEAVAKAARETGVARI